MNTTIDIGAAANAQSPRSSAESAQLVDNYLKNKTSVYGTIQETTKGSSKAVRKTRKAITDALKLDMASERTFFKWLRTGMQVGAIGTFVFIAVDRHVRSPWGVATVAFAWSVGLALVLFGLCSYYSRRTALRTDTTECIPLFVREHSPAFVVVALVSVVTAGLAYAIFVGGITSKHSVPRRSLVPS